MCNDKVTALTVETDCPSFRFPRTEKGNVLACSCMNGPRLPEAAPGRESCAGARVKSRVSSVETQALNLP